jgi:hypothetical protein
MLKLIYPEANEQLLTQCEGLMTNVIFNDSSNKLVKEASSNSITRDLLNSYKPDKDHFMIHFIGVGDYEKYGFNKNADAFPKLANEKYYDTFEKKAHLFREHKSDNPDVNAIGTIKKAAYNPEMGRIEVVAHCNIKKAAEEYEKAKAGGYLSCSMGAFVPADRDSINGQRSKSPAEYTEWMKKRPGQYIPEYKKYAFVYNDEPTFFDLSIVKRPAERIAHALEYKFAGDDTKDLLKTASSHVECIPSALLAEIEGIKYSLNTSLSDIKKASILEKLAKAEKEFEDVLSANDTSDKARFIKGAALNCYSKHDELDQSKINFLLNSGIKAETFFREMAKRAAVLPFSSFINFIYPENTEDKQEAVKLASCMLPSIFRSLPTLGIDLDSIESLFDAGSAIDCVSDCSTNDPVQKIMDEAGEKFSMEEDPRSKRIIKITIINNGDKPLDMDNILPQILKSANEVNKNELYNKAIKFSTAYALYKIAAIKDIEKFRGKDLDSAEIYSLIGQDYIYSI